MTAAELVVKISADIRGLEAGLLKAAAELKAFKQEAEGGAGATRDLATATDEAGSALESEAKKADDSSKSHSTLSRVVGFLTRNWQIMVPAAFAAAGGILYLTGNLGLLSAVVGPLTAVLGVFLMPLMSIAAIAVGFIAPLSTLVGLLGLLAAAFFLSGQKALSAKSPFSYLKDQVSILKGEFANLLRTLATDFMPVFIEVVKVAQQALDYFNKLAHMSLADAFKSLSTTGVSKLKELVRGIGEVLARPFRMAVSLAFGNNDTEHAMAGLAQRFSNYLFGYNRKVSARSMMNHGGAGSAIQHVPGALEPIIDWFNKQDFTATGQRWGNELAKGIMFSLKSVISNALKSSTAIGAGGGGLIGAILGGVAGAGVGNPMIGAAIGGILGAGLGAVVGHFWTPMKNKAREVWGDIRAYAETALGAIGHAIIAFLGPSAWGSIKALAATTWRTAEMLGRDAFNVVRGAIQLVWAALKLVWDIIDTLVIKTGAWKLAVLLIRGVVEIVANAIRGIITVVGKVIDWILRLTNHIENGLTSAVNGVKSAFDAVSGVIGTIIGDIKTAIGWAQSLASAVSGALGGSTKTPKGWHPASKYGTGATGGIVTRPTMALIGEAGPEAVVPLNGMPGARPLGGMGGGGVNINLNGPIIGTNPQLLARELARILQPYLGGVPSINIQGA